MLIRHRCRFSRDREAWLEKVSAKIIWLPYLEAQQEPLKAALVELVRIPSVCDAGEGGFPFGEAIDQALRKALQIAGDLGFQD